MKHNKQAFTLIELLVVVLIIGILAAIALPQYQKTVEKSKAAQAITLLKSVADAQERYFMATGSFALDLSELDIEINWPPSSKKWWEHATQSVSNGTWVLETSVWQGQVGFVVGLISGKHQGGAFGTTVSGHTHGAPYMSKREIECPEKTCCGTPYRNAAGNYCTKIFGGTFAYNDGGTRHYKLP